MIIELIVGIGLCKLLRGVTKNGGSEKAEQQFRYEYGRSTQSVREKPLTSEERDAVYRKNIDEHGHPKIYF